MSQLFRPQKPAWIDEFKTFLLRGNVIDLAVAVVIGAAFTGIVTSLVANIINPLIGVVTGGVDFSNHFITLKGAVQPTIAAAKKAGAVTLNYGLFVNAVINFVIVAFAIFWMIRTVQKLYRQPPPPEAAPAPTPTEQLLTEIRDLLKSRPQA
ncbi:large conductance mechanosensitive channel protein MscL [Acidiphilium iwatense]|uniref:Large-conductance mechanosensitive channel n=1 Tax=Acidiphilium iwatense TaxID=768198 RepID=A0ABS9DWA6_9PROT|nr:large conductance mechanosensitive channel protein MscL [Acidiphilium iwatense]MCF3947025.1 large conductance mechanosensitive channel protein MscL [Acidiphilium iwatense]